MALGVNTGWCTTGRYGHYGDPNFIPSEEDAKRHFNEYDERGIEFYYLLDPKTHYGEIAVAVYPEEFDVYGTGFTKNGVLVSTNAEIFNAQDELDFSLVDKLPSKVRNLLDIEFIDFSKRLKYKPSIKDIDEITLLSRDEANLVPDEFLAGAWGEWWLRSKGKDDDESVACVDGYGWPDKLPCWYTCLVRPALRIRNLPDLKTGDMVYVFDKYWCYVTDDLVLMMGSIESWDFGGSNEYEGSSVQRYLQGWLAEQKSKNESLKRGNKMTVEEYKKNRKARLQRLGEALDNLPELTDGKAHIEVDAVTGGAKAEAEDRKKQVKDSFKDKNKETREFIKKQDKDREVEKEDKSENRLMLDESLFNEEVELTESRDFDWD